jgi:hypothetical protein
MNREWEHPRPVTDGSEPGERTIRCGPTREIRTPAAAREVACRLLRAPGPLVVEFDEGIYPITATLALDAADSGTTDAPVVWRAAAGAKVVFSGGAAIHRWAAVSDPAVRARLAPEAREHVRVASLADCGIADAGMLRSRGFARPSQPAALELFFRGEPLTLARWPNRGEYASIAGVPAESLVDDQHGRRFGRIDGGFIYPGDRPARWAEPTEAWVHAYWAWDWADSHEQVASIDLQRRLVMLKPPHALYGIRPGQRFYVENVLEELDSPGEYYVDRAAGLVYVWPPDEPAAGDLQASLLETPLIRCTGVAHVRFENLTLEHGRGDAVIIEGGEGVALVGCTLRNVGSAAVIVRGGTQHRVERCVVCGCGAGGITLAGGSRATLEPAGHAAVGNVIRDVARWCRTYQPAVRVEGVGQTVAHNLIEGHPHCAILYGGNLHRIEGNEITRVCLETGDVGAIYGGRDLAAYGTVIRQNYLHDVGGVGMGSMGIYLDDCLSGQLVEGNVLVRLHRAVYVGGGRDNTIVGNLFIDCDPAIEIDARGLDDRAVWQRLVREHLLPALRSSAATAPNLPERFASLRPRLERLHDGDDTITPDGNLIASNACTGRWLLLSWGVEPGMLRVENNWTTEAGRDIGFVDRDAGDWSLRPDSPALRAGFRPIAFDRIGPAGCIDGDRCCDAAGQSRPPSVNGDPT